MNHRTCASLFWSVPKATAVLHGVVFTQEQQQNELPMRNWQCKSFLKYLRADLSWLESHDLTEYSFFVEVAASSSVGCSGLPKVPLCNACLEDTTTLATRLQRGMRTYAIYKQFNIGI